MTKLSSKQFNEITARLQLDKRTTQTAPFTADQLTVITRALNLAEREWSRGLRQTTRDFWKEEYANWLEVVKDVQQLIK